MKKLITNVDKLPQPTGLPDLKKILEEAMAVFKSDSERPKTNKVLVVVTDSDSPTTPADIKEAAEPLEKEGVIVIAVTVGNEANSKQLKKLTTDKQSPLNVSKDAEPDNVGDEIMKSVLEGWCIL